MGIIGIDSKLLGLIITYGSLVLFGVIGPFLVARDKYRKYAKKDLEPRKRATRPAYNAI